MTTSTFKQATSGLPESPERPLETNPWGFTWYGAISTVDYCIRTAQARIKADKSRDWYVGFEEFQLRELATLREYLLTEHEAKLGYAFAYEYPSSVPAAEQDS